MTSLEVVVGLRTSLERKILEVMTTFWVDLEARNLKMIPLRRMIMTSLEEVDRRPARIRANLAC